MAQKTGIFGHSSSKQTIAVQEKPGSKNSNAPKQMPPFNVVLLNDNDHTYEYVIHLLRSVFAYSEEKGYQLAKTVDKSSRAIVFTSHKELAELKREQIQAFGTDPRVAACRGSMSAVIEPAV